MKNLRMYFEIAFDDPEEISFAELKKFSEDHLARLRANNASHEFDSLIAATTTVYDAYFGGISSTDTGAAEREELTGDMDLAFEAFKALVSRREGTVRGEFGRHSAKYQAFFPHGMSEYANADLADAQMLMDRLVSAADANKARLGQGVLDEFTAARTAFQEARDAQLEQKGVVSDSRTDLRAARKALERQLTLNLLTLAIKFLGDPDAGLAFFDQSIIRPAQTNEETAGTTPPSP